MYSLEFQLGFAVAVAIFFFLGLKYVEEKRDAEATQKFKDKLLEIALKYHKPTDRFMVVLTKIESSHNNLRTDSVEGVSLLPEEGKSFILVAKPLTEGTTFRMVQTTKIKKLVRKSLREFQFSTENSTYSVKLIEKIEE